ncbi:hypothetical protein ACOBR2_06540 [Telmatobacter bradus]|uniref:hypothetical protein n=1 Tax=Telmatobacter bradus TaxID=474953 RepID=UPI003B433BC9
MLVIKEALEFLTNLQTPKNPQIVHVHESPYRVNADGTLGEVVKIPDMAFRQEDLGVATLDALAAAYTAKINGLNPEKVVIHVESPFQVVVKDITPDKFGRRAVHIVARHLGETPFKLDTYYTPEKFLIDFRASFFLDGEAMKVVQLCSTVEAGSSVSIADDGMSQKVTATAGTLSKAQITLPSEGVSLIPWRSFRDVNPVESKFLLRMKAAKDELPYIALFQIDEKWKLDTVRAIEKYLAKKLPEAKILA